MAEGTVLVVDDEPSIRLLCRVNLEVEGYRVLEADGLEPARRLLREHPVDVALLDVHIGAESGLGLVEELRRDWPSVRLALLTGTFQIEEPTDAQVDAVLRKPFVLEELIATVARLAARDAGAKSDLGS